MSKSRIGKKLSDDHKMKLSKIMVGNPLCKSNLGKKFSAEHKRKISETCISLGKKHSEETRKKISEAQKRRWNVIKQNSM